MKRASSPNLIELASNSLLIRINDRKNKKEGASSRLQAILKKNKKKIKKETFLQKTKKETFLQIERRKIRVS